MQDTRRVGGTTTSTRRHYQAVHNGEEALGSRPPAAAQCLAATEASNSQAKASSPEAGKERKRRKRLGVLGIVRRARGQTTSLST